MSTFTKEDLCEVGYLLKDCGRDASRDWTLAELFSVSASLAERHTARQQAVAVKLMAEHASLRPLQEYVQDAMMAFDHPFSPLRDAVSHLSLTHLGALEPWSQRWARCNTGTGSFQSSWISSV